MTAEVDDTEGRGTQKAEGDGDLVAEETDRASGGRAGHRENEGECHAHEQWRGGEEGGGEVDM